MCTKRTRGVGTKEPWAKKKNGLIYKLLLYILLQLKSHRARGGARLPGCEFTLGPRLRIEYPGCASRLRTRLRMRLPGCTSSCQVAHPGC